MHKDKHRLYVELMNKCSFKGMEGVLWGSVLYTRFWSILQSSFIKEILNVIKSILFATYEVNTNFAKNKILLVRNCNGRQDYNKIWSNLKSCIDTYDLIELRRKRKLDFHIIKNIREYRSIIKHMPSGIELKGRLDLSAWIMRITRLQQVVLSQLNDTRIVIFFFDGDPMENYLCQKIKLNFPNCITCTLQHGLYVYKKDDYDINQTGIRNLTADYIFAWGSFTEQQFIKGGINSKRVIKAGNLLNPINIKEEHKIKISKDTFGIICDAPSYDFARDKNNDMINIANQLANMFDLKFWIKLHPADSTTNYSINQGFDRCLGFYPKEKLMIDFVDDIDFALLHVSSAYIDLLILNCKSFKYNSEIYFPMMENKEETFDDLTDLFEKYEAWGKMSTEKKLKYLSVNRSNYIENGNTFEKYKEMIEMLLRV